jgi:hypothetical protein
MMMKNKFWMLNENFDALVNDHDYSIDKTEVDFSDDKKQQTLRFLEFRVLRAAFRNASKSSSSSSV